ncbi:plasmid recombination protein, partial [Bacillus thuringiensis]|nr:plasmid recombination protein [Bacillus thuringiensis]
MQKFQISDVQGIQKHNQRQGKSKSNLDIDYSKSEQNYDLLNLQKFRY